MACTSLLRAHTTHFTGALTSLHAPGGPFAVTSIIADSCLLLTSKTFWPIELKAYNTPLRVVICRYIHGYVQVSPDKVVHQNKILIMGEVEHTFHRFHWT